ncbi:MAG: hypothetical protein ACKVOE_10210 [Rickettsiales bacterium]
MSVANNVKPAETLAAEALTMGMYRNAAFSRSVALRLHQGNADGKTAEQVVNDIAHEQQAIASAIVSPEFIDAACVALLAAQQQVEANPRYQTKPAQANEAMSQIMHRRAAEATEFAQRVVEPSYYQPLLRQPPADKAITPSLHDVKMKEVLDDLLHLDAAGAPQVIAHIDATAKGMMLEHDALAKAFAPNGSLHKPLMKALATKLPSAPESHIHALTLEWLGQREAAAKLSSDLAASDGEAYIEAVRRSTLWHRQNHNTLPPSAIQTQELQRDNNPEQTEKEKTALQRAEDISYTINHALSCGTTDIFLQPIIAAMFGVNVGCNHHEHDGAHHHGHDGAHPHAKQKMTLKSFAHEAGHYLKGEIIGDFAAVPLTIGVQRLFPNFMNSLRKLMEPLTGWAFRIGANHSARSWAKKEGLAADAPEVATHAEEVYQHEISHLPQALVWNMFAYPIGAVAQKMGGHGRSYPEIFKSKLVGAVVSNGILIGGRMIAPGAAQKWDQVTGENVFLPVSKTVGKIFGVDGKTIEKVANKKKDNANDNWRERVHKEGKVAQL